MKIKNLIITLLLLVSFSSTAQNIFRTVCKGDLKRLDSLLQHSSINIQDNRDRSLLHWAIGCKKPEVFDALITKGIDFNIEDNQKRTPLHLAVNFESEHCFNTLQNLQTDNSWIDNYGPVLLESAVLNKSELFVEKLVKIGIDIDAKNERGSTPLEIAKRIEATEIYTLLLSLGADENSVRTFTMNGAYMGQKPPELIPSMFAPNFISTEESEFGSFFSTDGTEFYLGVDVNGKSEIRYSKMIGTEWSKPKTFLSHERYGYNDPFLSNDENRLYFISERALDGVGDLKDVDIWYIQKNDKTWSEPINAGPNINTDGNEYYISFTNEDTMYFSSNGHNSKKDDHDIYYSKNVGGIFQKSIPLGDAINTPNYEGDVFIAPDESYIIFCSTRDDGFGQGDLYISFKNSDDSWTTAVNMGEPLNTKNYEYCPFVSKDGNYLFYTSNQDIFWVSTDIINEIKNKM
ncbi:ankyrin repeat domain-containing protein [Flagellimonas eckloniae]|nr:ankyrin repeat domain-containing protein [Allomuricauda eckloniae]